MLCWPPPASGPPSPPPLAGSDCGRGQAHAQQTAWTGGPQRDIVEQAVAAGSFKTLAAALSAAGLADALKGDGPFTVFAPTDAAFARLPQGTVEALLKPQNRDKLTAILTYHLVAGDFPAARVARRTTLETLNGQRIDVRTDGGVRVDGATVSQADIECANGVIHVIDRVILPNTDGVLETAARAGSFETLAAAIKAAGLADTLSGKGPFTIFAPTDAAFAELPAGTLETLLRPENRRQLRRILTHHVVQGRVYAAEALDAQSAATVEGSRIRFTLGGGSLMAGSTSVVEADVEAANGVIHVIDAVLLPQ